MPQIISVVSKLLGPKDYCQLIMSLLDDHTKFSLLCVIESTADVVPSSPCGLLTASSRVTAKICCFNTSGYWAILKPQKSWSLFLIWTPIGKLGPQKAKSMPLQCGAPQVLSRATAAEYFFPFQAGEMKSKLWVVCAYSDTCIELNPSAWCMHSTWINF